jgi:hypothetical protein
MKEYSVKKYLKEQKEASKNSRAASKKVDIDLAHQELNDVDYEYTEFKVKNSELVEEKSTPVKDFRQGLATSLKNAGVIDSADIDKVVNDTEFNKATAEAFAQASKMHVRNALETGRYYQIDPGDKKTAKAVLYTKKVEKKDVATRSIVEKDGKYTSELTGDTVRTDAHNVVGISNRVGPHLKYKLDKSK